VLAANRHAANRRSSSSDPRNRPTCSPLHIRIVGAFAALGDGGSAASVGSCAISRLRTASRIARLSTVCV
jgi:hypothetical protein